MVLDHSTSDSSQEYPAFKGFNIGRINGIRALKISDKLHSLISICNYQISQIYLLLFKELSDDFYNEKFYINFKDYCCFFC
ncbi:hypothetical protein C5467_03215 [Photorhabdus khanii subsp. guanajuatensis]|uniref:Uncharacterized protein n=1 Tax=Photorhabdus khanii subsp. guanajuatensis TaxID=2100166 RepID=A0A4R4K443_9GAMM|nr:hypothetical protein C5467_03215 [Photorhabdus khanii subsp. guanajuatensis]